MDTLTALHGVTDTGVDIIRDIMRGYAMLLGLREAEASALAQAIASGPDRPANERQALMRVERAVLDPADADGPDKMLLATWLSGQDADREPSRLPQGAPVAAGLSMPAQKLDIVSLLDMAQLLGVPARPEFETGGRLGGDV